MTIKFGYQGSSRYSVVMALLGTMTLPLQAHAAAGTPEDNRTYVDEKIRGIRGEHYTLKKYIDRNGNIQGEIHDSRGNPVSEHALPRDEPEKVDPRVLDRIMTLEQEGRSDETIRVNIALEIPESAHEHAAESGEIEIIDGLPVRGAINGQTMTGKELENFSMKRARQRRASNATRSKSRGEALKSWGKRHGLQNHDGLDLAARQGRSGATLEMTPARLRSLIDSRDPAITAIELQPPAVNTLDEAMRATNVTDWALPYSNMRGHGIGIYQTELDCAGTHPHIVRKTVNTVSPGSYIYCSPDIEIPKTRWLTGSNGNPPISAVNISAGWVIKDYSTYDRDWDNFIYNNDTAVFAAVGNKGEDTGMIFSPAKGLNVLSVGNYDDDHNEISSTSSYVDAQTGNDKPEIVAPGENITGLIDLTYAYGTSISTPHAAGFAADLMSSISYLQDKPYVLKAQMMAGATDVIGGGYDKVGAGGIDFKSARWTPGYAYWYEGKNSSFNDFDEQDGQRDGYIEKRVYIEYAYGRKVRAVLSWLTRGSYTYKHRNDANSIGMDMDLRVYDPDGALLDVSASWDNPFEMVEFIPGKSGYYTFRINRFANRDSRNHLRMGLYVNTYTYQYLFLDPSTLDPDLTAVTAW